MEKNLKFIFIRIEYIVLKYVIKMIKIVLLEENHLGVEEKVQVEVSMDGLKVFGLIVVGNWLG